MPSIPPPTPLPQIDDEQRDQMLAFLLGLSGVKGIGFETLVALFDSGLLLNWWKYESDELLALLNANIKIKRKTTAAEIVHNLPRIIDTGRSQAAQYTKDGVFFVPQGHSHYPSSLLKMDNPPRWIFAKGSPAVLRSEAIIAVIGSREASLDGLRLAYKCGRDLALRNFVVLSGLARGIDEKAHVGAVDYYGQSIAVLGCGIKYLLSASERVLLDRILEFVY